MKDKQLLRQVLEGALLAAGHPLSVAKLQSLFETHADDDEEQEVPAKDEIQALLEDIQADGQGRGFELKEVASGWRFQIVAQTARWVNRLWDEKPQKYSRALLETLSLIAYRQPITRGDIEEIRGVAVSSHIIRTLSERDWVKVVGHRDVPGRPALYASTRQFLDYFNLASLDQLPSLSEIADMETLNPELELDAEMVIPPTKELSLDPEGDAAKAAAEAEAEAEAEELDMPGFEEEPDAETVDEFEQALVAAGDEDQESQAVEPEQEPSAMELEQEHLAPAPSAAAVEIELVVIDAAVAAVGNIAGEQQSLSPVSEALLVEAGDLNEEDELAAAIAEEQAAFEKDD